jgi:SAM-dependent methyltransferase
VEPVIKIDLGKALAAAPVRIDLGCGPGKKPGCIGVDRRDSPGVDIVADLEEGLPFLPDGCADSVACRSVMEHLCNFEQLVREIVRVLKPAGTASVYVPHFSNPYYYSDYSHKRQFGLYTFCYFTDPALQPARRKVPHHYSDVRIRIISQKLVFRSAFALEKPLRKLFGRLVNLSETFQQYYEENLCYMAPCRGIEVVFGRPH